MNLTPAQQRAVDTPGNVLVVAGAGSGKTSTLVERCVSCLLHGSATLDQILMLTFTDAAAAEMRQRIRERLESALPVGAGILPANTGSAGVAPADQLSHWQEQLALFETAHIGTLHSFCLELVRQHFYELELDPKFSVMSDEEARLLAHDTLEQLFDKHYASADPLSAAVQNLVQSQGGWDRAIRKLVLRIHEYSQTLPDPNHWFDEQRKQFSAEKPTHWHHWLFQAITDWRERWLHHLQEEAQNQVARICVRELTKLTPAFSRKDAEAVLQQVCAAGKNCPHGRKAEWRDPLKEFLAEADFLYSLTRLRPAGKGIAPASASRPGVPPATSGNPAVAPDSGRETDPLVEDWHWVADQMTTLLELARQFTLAFAEAKRELAAVDFHDLEQYALRLLWDPIKLQPTDIARQWRQKLRFVFVDEYQDINAAQDKIIECLGRDGVQGNRFLVGDVKQSIYRFRLANPAIFQDYMDKWAKTSSPNGATIPLSENFRSRETLLSFANAFFATVMRRDLGGVAYDDAAHLLFGAPDKRQLLSVAANPAPAVELHLRIRKSRKTEEEEENENSREDEDELAELGDVDKEARLLALRLRELHAQQFSVWDDTVQAFRPVQWSDMAILLRSRASKAESYAKEFARLKIPLLVERGNFYQTLEVSDLLNLLRLLDNPLQDLPVLAVLHSPLVGLTVDELATIRLTGRGPFWNAVLKTKQRGGRERQEPAGTATKDSTKVATKDSTKVSTEREEQEEANTTPTPAHSSLFSPLSSFLERFRRWRRLARHGSLSRCLDTILSETHYGAWLLTQSQGEQRYANVQRLLCLAQQFDRYQRHGLFRFLRFVEAQELAEVEPAVAAVSVENSVRLMSIHQSKGLEFPVVALPDLGKPFNVSDQRAELILDERFGLCPQIKPPHAGKRYPSLPHWLASRRQHNEMLGEELRLLYVAMTRAKDRLILNATVSERKFNERWKLKTNVDLRRLASTRCYADWLGCWFAHQFDLASSTATSGENNLLSWRIHEDQDLLVLIEERPAEQAPLDEVLQSWPQLRQRLDWHYPFMAATSAPAKSSATLLRRRATQGLEEESAFRARRQAFGSKKAEEIGSAHHKFLQLVSLRKVSSIEELRHEAERLEQEGCFTPKELALLDFEGLAAFWQSELGRQLLANKDCVQRELLFTARFSLQEVAAITGDPPQPNLDEEFVVVQGIADLVVILPSGLLLIDFKTDHAAITELPEKVKLYEPQMRLYAHALSRIYSRPVTDCWLYFLAARTAVSVSAHVGIDLQRTILPDAKPTL